MAFGAGQLIQTITRSSTTRSWPTDGQTAVYLSRVSQWKEPGRRPPPQRCPSVRWKVLPQRLRRRVSLLYPTAVPPLYVVRPGNLPKLQIAFSSCGHLAQRTLKKRKAGHRPLKRLSALARKVKPNFHPLLWGQRVKEKLSIYPIVKIPFQTLRMQYPILLFLSSLQRRKSEIMNLGDFFLAKMHQWVKMKTQWNY